MLLPNITFLNGPNPHLHPPSLQTRPRGWDYVLEVVTQPAVRARTPVGHFVPLARGKVCII